MKTYLQMDGHALVEYVEKREYDAVVLALRDAHNRLEQQLQDAVKRLSEVTDKAIESAYWSSWTSTQIVRDLFISAAKGEQP